jgi:hypothetical protein
MEMIRIKQRQKSEGFNGLKSFCFGRETTLSKLSFFVTVFIYINILQYKVSVCKKNLRKKH